MGRLVPAGTGMEYYRQVKIAGEDVVEEPVAEPLEVIPGYDEETRLQYAGGEDDLIELRVVVGVRRGRSHTPPPAV